MRIVIITLVAGLLGAQSFEVVSIKANHSGSGGSSAPRLTKGRLTATNTTVKWMIEVAWGLNDQQVTGPAWIEADRFDLAGTAPAGVTDTEIKPMLQGMLKERFGFVSHMETREMPIYNLVVAKEGLKIKPFDPQKIPPEPPRMPGTWGTMYNTGTLAQLANNLAGLSGRPVVDKTGLEGRYYCRVQYSQTGTAAADLDQAPDIFGAVQQQLGLRLEPARGPVEMLVVDHIERTPTEN